MRTIILVPFVAALAGCASDNSRESESPILVLDNMGGFSHAGRRIELGRNGNVVDTRYTDIQSDAESSVGRYHLEGDVLNLRFGDRGNQTLNRISYGGRIYWVYPGQANELRDPKNKWFRQTALKQQAEQGAGDNSAALRASP